MPKAPFGFTYKKGLPVQCTNNWYKARLLIELAIQHELSYPLIVRDLPTFFPWTPSQWHLRRWLMNPTLRGGIGQRIPGSHRWIKVEWGQGPSLISISEWRQIKHLLYLRGSQPGRNGAVRLFTRLIRCAGCSKRFQWDTKSAHYICRSPGCCFEGAQLEEEQLKTATIVALTKRAAPRMARLAMEWADHQIESESFDLMACRDRLDQLETLQCEGVLGLNVAIRKLRDQIVTLSPSVTCDGSTVYECLLRDPITLGKCSNNALRKIFLEFAIEIKYVGDRFRVSIGHLN